MQIKDKAAQYFDKIGEGHKAAVRRPLDGRVDREFRHMIEEANNHGDCIISGGGGYYRPIPTDPIDYIEYRTYILQETSRWERISNKVFRMKEAYEEKLDQELKQ